MSKEIGMRLRQARESMGMTLTDVARKINIELKYLIAIEKGEWDRLPNIIYARAYVKSYAQLVGENVRMTRSSRRGPVTTSNNTEPIYQTRSRSERYQQQKGYQADLIQTNKRRIARQIQAEVIDSDEPEIKRKIPMPNDMPDPEEIGIVEEIDEDQVVETEDTDQETVSYTSLPSRREKERKMQQKQQQSNWGIWYTRILILGGVLLVLGFGFFLYLKLTSPAGMPIA